MSRRCACFVSRATHRVFVAGCRALPRATAPLPAIVLGSATALFFALDQIMYSSFLARVWLFPLVSVACAMMTLSGMRRMRPRPFSAYAASYCARVSYAVYLAHMPVFHLITHFAGSTAPDDLFGAVTRWASFFVGSCFVAALVERRVEHPILEWRDRVIPR